MTCDVFHLSVILETCSAVYKKMEIGQAIREKITKEKKSLINYARSRKTIWIKE